MDQRSLRDQTHRPARRATSSPTARDPADTATCGYAAECIEGSGKPGTGGRAAEYTDGTIAGATTSGNTADRTEGTAQSQTGVSTPGPPESFFSSGTDG